MYHRVGERGRRPGGAGRGGVRDVRVRDTGKILISQTKKQNGKIFTKAEVRPHLQPPQKVTF